MMGMMNEIIEFVKLSKEMHPEAFEKDGFRDIWDNPHNYTDVELDYYLKLRTMARTYNIEK